MKTKGLDSILRKTSLLQYSVIMDFLPGSVPLRAIFPVVGICVAWALYSFLIYPLLISPLSRVPGPKVAALTSWYLDSLYWKETGCPFVEELHRKYGPIVRVGPNEVVVNDPEQVQVIYGVRSSFPKPPSAVLFANFGTPNAFSAVTREEHRQRRRRVAKVYTMSSLLSNERLMQWLRNRMEKVLSKMNDSPNNMVDVYQLSAHFALDNVSFMAFGKSMCLLEGNNLEAADCIRLNAIASCPITRFQLLIYILGFWPLSILMPDFLKRSMNGQGVVEKIIKGEFDQVTGSEKKCDPRTAAGCIQNCPEYGTAVTDDHVLSECADHILAGKIVASDPDCRHC